MKHCIIGLILIMVLLSEITQAQTKETPPKPTQSERHGHRGKHGHHHNKFRIWPFHRHGKEKHKHTDHHGHSDRSERTTEKK